MNKHEHICEALELFAADVMPEFKSRMRRARTAQTRGARAVHRGGAGAQGEDEAA